MKKMLFLLVLPFVAPQATAAVDAADFPSGTVWYLHADLKRMRDSASGREMYRWLNGEVFVDINEDVGIDINGEVDRLTAFSHDKLGTIVVIEGPVSDETRDKVIALASRESGYDVREFQGQTYYFAGDDVPGTGKDNLLNDLDESTYFSFALPGKVLVASHEEQIRELMKNKGRIAGSGSHDGALFVLSADKQFVQAGLRTDRFADDDHGWNSNILRNTEQAAFLVSDRDGLLAVEAQIKSADARMAQSIGSIVNGLVSLQLFNSDLDPDIRALIQSTKIEVKDSVLNISSVFDPEAVLRLLED